MSRQSDRGKGDIVDWGLMVKERLLLVAAYSWMRIATQTSGSRSLCNVQAKKKGDWEFHGHGYPGDLTLHETRVKASKENVMEIAMAVYEISQIAHVVSLLAPWHGSRAIASQNFANNILNSSKRYKFDSSLADIH
ncbi:uncharacterized protein LAJ45_05564 [Morchella importuna]|uniref:uncharacterized protein n=1 Tax=Morchella importuna TaxID=1174673 RepID=UPI001E8CA41E|nr:uncharacterized protein LAJ45_05564 [Morchella importuna]KAH8150353.1 hypothetical protein LAJ45_05564 [Morchella importuna]